MRTKLMASVAVALMGVGATAFASESPFQAVVDGAAVMAQGDITLADDPNNLGNFDQDRYIDATTNGSFKDTTRGEELAALVWAQQIGAGGATIQTYVNNVAANIMTESTNFDGGNLAGDEAWGLAKAGSIGVTGATSYVQNFYNSFVGTTNAAIDAKATSVAGGSLTAPDNQGVWLLSNHVLASNLVGSTNNVRWRDDLLTAVGGMSSTTDAGTETTTKALATALWALRTTGATGTTDPSGSGAFANKTLADLKAILTTDGVGGLYDSTNNVFYTSLNRTTEGNAEDLAYAILAIKAFNDVGDATLINTLEAKLAAAVSAVDGTPLNVLSASGYSAQYSSAALQALPEPATLSLLALGGLGLLARRRRQS